MNFETKNALFSIEEDVFNTGIFKLKMGNFDIQPKQKIVDKNFEIEINNCINKAKSDDFDHLTCKIDTNYSSMVQALERTGFCLSDTLVTYRFNYRKSRLPQLIHQCQLDDCKKEDLRELKHISKKAFEIDRFHSDEALENKDCDHYYEQWIENSYNGFADRVIVAYLDGIPVGYTTAKLPGEDDVGHLVLSAVSGKSRGKGVYTSMIYEGVKWMEGKANKLQVGTQINNVAVQKAWIKLGFTVNDSQYVFQRKI